MMLSAARVPWHSHTEHQRHIIRLVTIVAEIVMVMVTLHNRLMINCEDLTVNAKYCSILVMIYDLFVKVLQSNITPSIYYPICSLTGNSLKKTMYCSGEWWCWCVFFLSPDNLLK